MTDTSALVEHLFRREAGRIVACLTRSLGSTYLELAEESVQDAMIRALQMWPFQGIPDNPSAWLTTVARNRALDRIRRDARLQSGPVPELAAPPTATSALDDQVALIFLCCHPSLSGEAQLALTLKTVCGFSVREIARALMSQDTAIAQRLVRAKRQIREARLEFEIPPDREMAARLDAVLRVVYLPFNEGYSATEGESLLRTSLCEEAVRIALLIADNPATALPEAHALAALLLLQSARLDARTDDAGNLLTLDEQDRSKWDQRLIALGLRRLDLSSGGSNVSRYHGEAEIASIHATTGDWPRIRDLYDTLYSMDPSPVVALNRAVAIARVEGPRSGLQVLEALAEDAAFRSYHLLPAVTGRLWQQAGNREQAARFYRLALERRCSEPERVLLLNRLAEVQS